MYSSKHETSQHGKQKIRDAHLIQTTRITNLKTKKASNHRIVALTPPPTEPVSSQPPRPSHTDPASPVLWPASTAISHLRGALLPLHVHNLGEFKIGRVGGEETSGSVVGGGQADLRVDVEHARGAAGRPDNRRAVGSVVLEVVTVDGTLELVLRAGLKTKLEPSHVLHSFILT